MTKTTIANNVVRAGLASLATIAMFASVPASAAQQAQERVTYVDLDLAKEGGQATLDKRIRAAVKRVCGQPSSGLAGFTDWQRCKRHSLADATRQMNFAIARAGPASRTGIAANMAVVRFPAGKP